MFKYKGPKGVRVGCVLDDEEAKFGLKLQTDVAITMPKYLGKLVNDEDIIPSKLRVVVYDEADLALEQTPTEVLTEIFDTNSTLDGDYVPYERDNPRLSFMVGASVTEALGSLVVRSRILPEGKSYIATATRNGPIAADSDTTPSGMMARDQPKTASLKDLDLCLEEGLKHQRVLVGNETTGLLVLTRLLRKELRDFDENASDGQERPRVVVFFPDEESAKKCNFPAARCTVGRTQTLCLTAQDGCQSSPNDGAVQKQRDDRHVGYPQFGSRFGFSCSDACLYPLSAYRRSS